MHPHSTNNAFKWEAHEHGWTQL